MIQYQYECKAHLLAESSTDPFTKRTTVEVGEHRATTTTTHASCASRGCVSITHHAAPSHCCLCHLNMHDALKSKYFWVASRLPKSSEATAAAHLVRAQGHALLGSLEAIPKSSEAAAGAAHLVGAVARSARGHALPGMLWNTPAFDYRQ